MINGYDLLLPLAILAITIAGAGLFVFRVYSTQAQLIAKLMRQNSELTLKLMARDLTEYAEARSVLPEEEPLPEVLPPLPGSVEAQIEETIQDPRDFPEELVGTVSGEEPSAVT